MLVVNPNQIYLLDVIFYLYSTISTVNKDYDTI